MMIQLNALIGNFGASVKIMLPYAESRQLESFTYPLTLGKFENGNWIPNTDAFMQAVRDAAEKEIGEPGRNLAKEFAAMEFRQGTKYADKEIAHLKRIPVVEGPVGIQIGGGYSPRDIEIINRIVANNLIEIDKITNDMATLMSREIREGLATGEGLRAIGKRIDDVTDIGRSRAVTIARTEIMYGINTSARERIQSQGYSRMERVEAEDERTCTDFEFNINGKIYQGCAAINGVIFTFEEAAQVDEQSHPNCRGSWIPVMTDAEAAATDAEG